MFSSFNSYMVNYDLSNGKPSLLLGGMNISRQANHMRTKLSLFASFFKIKYENVLLCIFKMAPQ